MARNGGDHRGSAASRRARKLWLLGAIEDRTLGWAPFGGNGTTVKCALGCGEVLTFATVEADRIIPGGSYRRENVQPACRPCNLAKSDDELTVEEVAERVLLTVSRTGRKAPALG